MSPIPAVHATRVSPRNRIVRLASAAWRAELAVWVGLYRFIFRRIPIPPGASGFGSHRPIFTIMMVFIALSAVEISIIDLIVHPWPGIRIPMLISGIWGLTWMVGFTLGFLSSPHTVGPKGIIVRQGSGVEIVLDWDMIASVARDLDSTEKAPRVRDEASGRTVGLRMMNETNLLIELERPVTARLMRSQYEVDAIRLWADVAPAFLAATRTSIP